MMYTTVAVLTNLGQFDVGGELKLGSDGLLYGSAYQGQGSVYKTSIDGAVTFIPFDGTNGTYPGMPLPAPDGKSYSVASRGGSLGAGTVYCLETNGNPKAIYSFDMTNGGNPIALLVRTNGELYGVTLFGGNGFNGTLESGNGVIFKLTTNGDFTRLASFSGTNNEFPNDIVEGTDGNFYGTCNSGGPYQNGSIFRVTPDGQLSTLATFDGTNGASPRGIISASDGALYGCTGFGGPGFNGLYSGSGTVFRVSTNGDFTVLHEFNSTDGAEPMGHLLEVSNGVFYGVTYYGGLNGPGTIFQISTNGDFSVLLNFDSTWSKNSNPVTGLAKGPDGNFYGVTSLHRREIYCLRPVEAPVLQSSVQDGQMNFSWNAWGGLTYQLISKTNLNDPLTYFSFVGGSSSDTNTIGTYSEPIDPNTPRFYSLRIHIRENWWGQGALPYP